MSQRCGYYHLIIDLILMANHAVHYFSNVFCFAGSNQKTYLVDVLPSFMEDRMNALLIMIPSKYEISRAVFNLNKSSALGPNGFEGFFFHTY